MKQIFLHDDYSRIGLKEPGVSKPKPHAALHSPKHIDFFFNWPDGVNHLPSQTPPEALVLPLLRFVAFFLHSSRETRI